jgi:hypothetical protein
MRAREFVAEALKPSQYRSMVKGWDSQRLADIFQRWPGTKNRTATRLYIDLPQNQTLIQPDPQVSNKLKQLGYEVVDYTRGLAKKTTAGNQNPTKIGKILAAAVQQGDNTANAILQKFQNDPKRGSTRAEYQGVVSRHPYDVAGMSTDRGWTSCQDLSTGTYCVYVPDDIKAGTLVAYMIRTDDPDIKSPVGRILLKPYINKNKQTAYAPHTETYGTVTKEFEKAVSQFAVWINKQTGVTGLFKINPKVYFDHDGEFDDNDSYINVVDPDASRPELIKILKKNSNHIKHILDAGIRPDEDLQRLAVSNNGYAIKYIVDAGIEPSKAVQLAAVRDLSSIIEHIVNAGIQPDKEVQMAAVNRNPGNIRYLAKAGIQPDEEVQIAAVSGSDNGINIRYIIDAGITPSEDVQIAAVGGLAEEAIYFITNAGIELSEKVQLAAMKKYAWVKITYIIKAVGRPSERVQLAAVDNDGDAIESIIDAGIEPSKAVVEKAKENGWRGEYKK